jgi:hypothetical protein
MGPLENNSATNIMAASAPVANSLFYSYNPYNPQCSIVIRPRPSQLPRGTLHLELENRVSFIPYPTEEFVAVPPSLPKTDMVRVFIGQMPYQVTDMQLQWLCNTFGRGGAVYFPERIMKRDETRGSKVPTGCIHAYGDPKIYDDLMSGMHKRLLIDDTGVWYAKTAEETAYLNEYCHQLKQDRRRRFPNRPYDTVVVQHATSTYVPPTNNKKHRRWSK